MLDKHCRQWIKPYTWVSLTILIIAVILSLFTPAFWAVENGPIEWLQVVVLGGVCILAVLFSFKKGAGITRKLFLWSVPVWLLMIGRELSWGRAFLHNVDGTMPKMSELWYGQYVEQAVFIISLITLGELFKHGLFAEVRNRIKQARIPAIDIAIVVGCAVFANLIEHYGAGMLGDRESVFEELAELVAYSVLFVIMANMGFDRSHHTAPLSTFIKSYMVSDLYRSGAGDPPKTTECKNGLPKSDTGTEQKPGAPL